MSSSVLGGALVQLMIHRTRRHITQNIGDLAEAAVKVGDQAVIQQIAELIHREAKAQAPKKINRRGRYELSIIILAMGLTLAFGGSIGALLYVDGMLKSGVMKSAQADFIWQGSLVAASVIMATSYVNFAYARHKYTAQQARDDTESSRTPYAAPPPHESPSSGVQVGRGNGIPGRLGSFDLRRLLKKKRST
ncbi:UNVERIFIED_ORG: hypothetical protein J3D58_002256 [Paenarthrobacter nicotinovorans]